MKRSDRFYIYLSWPKYLAQWYAHEMYRLQKFEEEVQPPYMYDCCAEVEDLEPVSTRRGSAERNILEYYLAKQPDSIPELPDRDATICIEIPSFLGKPTSIYNYLPAEGKDLLLNTVRVHFRKELTKYMNKMLLNDSVSRGNYGYTREKLVEAFMAANGIEYNEMNLEAIKKTWSRLMGYRRNKKWREKQTNAESDENTGNT